MRDLEFVGAAVLISGLLVVASQTYSDTVRVHDENMLRTVEGFIGCRDGKLLIRNITFDVKEVHHPFFDLTSNPCIP